MSLFKSSKAKMVKCTTCNAKGMVQPGSFLLERGVPQTCPTCHGRKKIPAAPKTGRKS